MSIILDEVKSILRKIKEEGIFVNDTKEIQNVISIFKRKELKIEEEESEIMNYYNNNIENYYSRLKLEKNHYAFLEAFLKHKLGEVMYFHRNENLTSRKFVIWSQDCIAAIQFLHRENKNYLNVFIRSSDAVRLLPIDFLYMIKILDKVLEEFNLDKKDDDTITFFITSSHFYLKDEKLVDEIIK